MSHERSRGALRTVKGVSPLVINPTNSAANWATNQTQSTPVTVLSITNPSAANALTLEVKVLHLVYAAMTALQTPKVNGFAVYSLINFDNGSGNLQLLPLNPLSFGNSQLASTVTGHDTGQSTLGGTQVAETEIVYVDVLPGATVTLRARSDMTITDGDTLATAYTVCQISAFGVVEL